MTACPLCGEPINEVAEIKKLEKRETTLDGEEQLFNYESLTKIQKSKLFWEISAIILVSGIIVTLIIDLMVNKTMSWSRYSITVSLVLFVNITLFTFFKNKVGWLFSGSFVTTSLLLILLDLYNHNIGWALELGIPFLFCFYFITLIMIIFIRKSKQRGFNIIAWFFIAIGLYAICIEGILSIYKNGFIHLQWSIVVMVCMIPVSAILAYIHYRLKRGIDLKRVFHI